MDDSRAVLPMTGEFESSVAGCRLARWVHGPRRQDERLRREDRMREAMLNRQERMPLAAEPRTAGLVSRLFYQIGAVMAAWGERLKQRYGCAGELRPSAAGDCR